MAREKYHTPTLTITNIGTILMAPNLIMNLPTLTKATAMGMHLDDFHDFSVQPRPLTYESATYSNDDPEIIKPKLPQHYLKFLYARDRLLGDPKIDKVIKSNTMWFISKIHYLEGTSISRPLSDWENTSNVREYRESVAMTWALYLSSLNKSKHATLDLHSIDNRFGFDTKFWIDWFNNDFKEFKTEKLLAKRLFYSALVFQVVSDYGKQDFSRKHQIPGFYTYNENDKENIAGLSKYYLQQAIMCGCNGLMLITYQKLFNKLQLFLKPFIKNSAEGEEWLYS